MNEHQAAGAPRVGDPIRFAPWAFTKIERGDVPYILRGRVCYVNAAHRWFEAEAEVHGVRLREGYKF